MRENKPVVYIVDDDPFVIKLLNQLIRSVGLEVESFASADDFLAQAHAPGPSCLILDLRMPGLSGLDLQERLAEAGVSIPIIFITGFGSVSVSVRAMKAGAVDFLEKPFENQVLIDTVHRAIEKSVCETRCRIEIDELRRRVETLTQREREVFTLVVTGAPNKQIAAELGLSEKTVKFHRARVMHKMRAQSIAELVQMAGRIPLCPVRA